MNKIISLPTESAMNSFLWIFENWLNRIHIAFLFQRIWFPRTNKRSCVAYRLHRKYTRHNTENNREEAGAKKPTGMYSDQIGTQ